jgi:hypothetical protein
MSAAAWIDDLEHTPTDAHEHPCAVALLPFRAENVPVKHDALRDLTDEIKAL